MKEGNAKIGSMSPSGAEKRKTSPFDTNSTIAKKLSALNDQPKEKQRRKRQQKIESIIFQLPANEQRWK